jgi:hypothetical protein
MHRLPRLRDQRTTNDWFNSREHGARRRRRILPGEKKTGPGGALPDRPLTRQFETSVRFSRARAPEAAAEAVEAEPDRYPSPEPSFRPGTAASPEEAAGEAAAEAAEAAEA